MKLVFIIILSILYITIGNVYKMDGWPMFLLFGLGWYGSMIWDFAFFRKSEELTIEQAEERSYYIVRVNLHDKHRFAFTKNFKLGDEVYYLGHDGVGGWWHGDTTTADEELMRKKDNLDFYKKVSKIKD
jgi:hypothetical protein